MEKSLLEFRDYKDYLTQVFKNQSNKRSGKIARLAQAIGCHSAYISQVLKGKAHFSLEQSERINQFLNHSKLESHFFILLVQYERAGTNTLKKYFLEQIELAIEKQFELKNRLQFKKTLSKEDQTIYYSAWYYSAVHVLVSVPSITTKEDFSKYLGLSVEKITEVLDFLTSVGLILCKDNRYSIGTSSIHLDRQSPMISKHHTNWRMKAIQSLEHVKTNDLHYSSVITASEQDSVKIRAIMVKAIEDIRTLVSKSKDERGFSYNMDFFEIKQ